jgi:hypothetical protein
MRTLTLALILLGLAASAYAEWTCYKDADGDTQCYNTGGESFRCYTDANGDQHCYGN